MTAVALHRKNRGSWVAPAVAVGLAVIGAAVGWRGVDLPAQLYRINLFKSVGLTLWDSQWYGGHWVLDYSAIFPAIAAYIGVHITAALSAAGAAWAFDRLVVGHFGPQARVGSALYAIGTAVQLSIGQLPFLMGEAFALAACLAAVRGKWVIAILLALATTLASPLAGAFLALALVAWLLAEWPRRRVGLMAAVLAILVPVGVDALLFPGQGNFPFPFADLAFELPACILLWLLVPRKERALWVGAGLYTLALTVCFFWHTPLGGNIGRLGESFAIPIGACLLWPQRRKLLVVLAIPMAVWVWTPAWGALVNNNARQPSTHAAFDTPLVSFLQQHDEPLGRVEVVPTKFHWETVYVAPTSALARGWERQLDTADNPIFYEKNGLDAVDYQSWLLDNGVRYVALANAPLDYAAVTEAALVRSGLPDLQLAWHNADWRVFSVSGSTGIADGPATLVSVDGGKVAFDATGPGAVTLRVRYSPHWVVTAGAACIRPTSDQWMELDTSQAGPVQLAIRLTGANKSACA
jgi:hypothetical protein